MCNISIGHTLVCPITVAERCISAIFLSFKGLKEVLNVASLEEIGGNTAVKSTNFSPLTTMICYCKWYFVAHALNSGACVKKNAHSKKHDSVSYIIA